MKIIIISILLFFTANAQTVWYVDRDATGANTGRSWTDAWTGLDSSGYGGYNGVNWAIIGDGDSIYISGGTDSTAYINNPLYAETYWIRPLFPTASEYAFNTQVVITKAWHTNHNGEVYITTPEGSTNNYGSFAVAEIRNVKFLNLNIIDRRGNTTSESNFIGLYANEITLDSCYIWARGVTGGFGLGGLGNKVLNCMIEYEENNLTNNIDVFGSGVQPGGHVISGNTIILRNGYTAISGDANGMTVTDTSMTDTDLSMEVDYHRNVILAVGVSAMTITSNTSNTFYGTWEGGTPSNGTAWSISGSHRDIIQLSGDGDTTNGTYIRTVISNNMIIDQRPEGTGWNALIYSTNMANMGFLIYNNIIVNQKTNTTGVGIWMDALYNAAETQSVYAFNNTFIMKGTPVGTGILNSNIDTTVAINNIFIIDTTYGTQGESTAWMMNLAVTSVKDIDYNHWARKGGLGTDIFAYNNLTYNWTEWIASGYDVNSDTSDSDDITFTNKYDTLATGYYTTTGRDLGVNLEAEYPALVALYPDMLLDILGNPRDTANWDIGALEYIGVTVDSLPNAFTFTDITNAARTTSYVSNAITLAGFDSAYARAGGGLYNVNGGSYVTGYTRVFPNDVIRVRLTSSSSYSTATSVTLTVGTRTDTYTVTTEASPVVPSGKQPLKGSDGKVIKDSTGKVIKR